MRRHAEALVDVLVDSGPLTREECCEALGWSTGRFSAAVKCARDEVCPDLGLALPAPTPASGWVYQVTTEWGPVNEGAVHTIGVVETRMAAMARDVAVILPNLKRGSVEWRRANFLNKHLSHVLGTLKEIN